ncbi:DUF5110 domain-containing protein [candidate division KSB1 bacterium]|nr:DUF5110 domain-containing protein [candidate division KSB1 bacterium]
MKLCKPFCPVIGLIFLLFWQCNSNVSTVTNFHNGIHLETMSLNLDIRFYADDVVRVVKWTPDGTPDKLSLSVIQDILPDVKLDIHNTGSEVHISSAKLHLRIAKKNGRITFLTYDDRQVLNETGNSTFEPFQDTNENAFHVEQQFKLTRDEGLYGLGQHQDGYFNYRGKTVTLVQTNTDAVNPFLISTNGYGILWDNYSKTIFNDTKKSMSLWSDVGDNIDYYFVYGPSMDEVIAGYRYLTGQAPLYGKWAYGYWQSKEHYKNRDELLGIAREYRKRQIPIDNIIQDWNYWDGNPNWSQMFFDERKYPQPAEMVNLLHGMNYHIMISIWPGLGYKTAIYKDMQQRGYLFDRVGWAKFKYYDAFIPEANDLYWQYLKKGLYSTGIDAWWIDSTEPDIINATMKCAEEYEMKLVGKNHLGSWARYLNAYSLAMMDKLYENQRKETDQKRVYMLTRSAFAGQQRTAATTWSGDIGASWDVYKKQISAGLNFCMAGIPYWTFDIGAFVLGAYDGVFTNGGKDPAYQELYARMFQFGAFCPIFRAHGSETPREIWEFGDFTDSMIKIDNLRYRLLPYIYSLAWQVTDKGYTIMRGLPMDFSADKNTYSISDQFMFGPAIMVCPVTEYMLHRPPEKSVLITPEHFKTIDGASGLQATFFSDANFTHKTHEEIVPDIDFLWYTGRPDYMTDSSFSVILEGKVIPTRTGEHQFHMKCYDAKRLFLDGKELPIVYTSVEQYTDLVELEAGRAYDFKLEVSNSSTGAAKLKLNWKTPDMFAEEAMKEEREQTRQVYLPTDNQWFDFWTGTSSAGGQTIVADAPIEIIPLQVKAGSILPLGPFVQYAAEKPADPLELRIYPGADGTFTLYEDENDTYDYENGVYATIDFSWNDQQRELTIHERKGTFPGMLYKRTFNIVLVSEHHGTGIEITTEPDTSVVYDGKQQIVKL